MSEPIVQGQTTERRRGRRRWMVAMIAAGWIVLAIVASLDNEDSTAAAVFRDLGIVLVVGGAIALAMASIRRRKAER